MINCGCLRCVEPVEAGWAETIISDVETRISTGRSKVDEVQLECLGRRIKTQTPNTELESEKESVRLTDCLDHVLRLALRDEA